MAVDEIYRRVLVKMWRSGSFAALTPLPPSGQSLWLYLLTCPETSAVPGAIPCGRAGLAEALGWELDDFQRCWAELEREGMAVADWKARLVWLPKALEINPPASPNVVKRFAEHFALLPDCEVKDRIRAGLRAFCMARGPEEHEGKGKSFAETFAEAFGEAMPQAKPEATAEALPEGLCEGFPKGFEEGFAKALPKQEEGKGKGRGSKKQELREEAASGSCDGQLRRETGNGEEEGQGPGARTPAASSALAREPRPGKAAGAAKHATASGQPQPPAGPPTGRAETDPSQLGGGDADATGGELVFPVAPRGTWTLPAEQVARYVEAFPTLDVTAVLRQAQLHCEAHPTLCKPAERMLVFLRAWLAREARGLDQPQGGQRGGRAAPPLNGEEWAFGYSREDWDEHRGHPRWDEYVDAHHRRCGWGGELGRWPSFAGWLEEREAEEAPPGVLGGDGDELEGGLSDA